MLALNKQQVLLPVLAHGLPHSRLDLLCPQDEGVHLKGDLLDEVGSVATPERLADLRLFDPAGNDKRAVFLFDDETFFCNPAVFLLDDETFFCNPAVFSFDLVIAVPPGQGPAHLVEYRLSTRF